MMGWAAGAVPRRLTFERKGEMVEELVELPQRRFSRGERVWWATKKAAQIAATVLRTGKVWATVIVAMNGSGHWYTQRARLDDMRLRTEHLAVDVIADQGLERLP
jgi:hypothetical protein